MNEIKTKEVEGKSRSKRRSKAGRSTGRNEFTGKGSFSRNYSKSNRGFNTRQKDTVDNKIANPGNNSDYFNDPSWWLPSGVTAQYVASYPWNTMAGFDIAKSIDDGDNGIIASEAPNIAGVMRFDMQSTFPKSFGKNSALNRASLGLFADILTKNSSNTSFEHTDLTMSMFAISDIDSWLSKGARAYALIKHYPVKNRYQAKTLVEACGFVYDDLVADPYAFISRLNVYIGRRNRFYVPATFNWRKREMWLSDSVYCDSDDPKAQFYVFNKDSYSVWSPRTSDQGSQLLQKSALAEYGEKLRVLEYFAILDEMLTPLENDQDIYQMQGYILKRYDASQLAQYPNVNPDIEIKPVIDYTVLTMIQNAKVYTDTELEQTQQYTPLSQEDGHFSYNPLFETNALNCGNILLTSCFNEPTADQTIEATRLILGCEAAEFEDVDSIGRKGIMTANELTADVISSVRIYSLPSDGNPIIFTYTGIEWGLNLSALTTNPRMRFLATQVSYFDFHPIIPVVYKNGTNLEFVGYLGDFDNTMILTRENLGKMNYTLSYGIVNIVDTLK